MENIPDKNKTMQDTFQKLKIILTQNKSDETVNDLLFKYQLKLIFIPKDDSYTLAFDKEEYPIPAKLTAKLVDFLFLIFRLPKKERESFYNLNVYNIKDKIFLEIIRELQPLQDFDIIPKNNKLASLFKIISDALDQKPTYSLSEYIDSILFNLSFISGLESLLKYQLYSLLNLYYLNPMHVVLGYDENEINITDDISLDLILEIFTNNQNDFKCLIKSIIFLNYGSLRNIIMNYKFDAILSGIENIYLKLKNIKNVGNLSLCVEKIMKMFEDELKRPKGKKRRKKKPKKLENCEKTEKEIKDNSEDKLKNEDNKINLNEDIKSEKDDGKIIESVDSQNDNKDDNDCKDNLGQSSSEKFNKYFNNLINNIDINLGNENIKEDIKNFRDLMINFLNENVSMNEKLKEMDGQIKEVVDENYKIKGQIKEVTDENSKIKGQIKEMNQDIEGLKERVEFLENECQDMKGMLGNLQCRDLSKNFLRCFGTFLTEEDWKSINKDKNKKGKIIAERIKQLYPNAKKEKMEIVLELVKNSFNLIKEGNNLAHSLTLDLHKNELNAYKQKNNLKKLTSPIKFCFLISLRISDELFDNAYSFLIEFFNNDLSSIKGDNWLEIYFK